VTIQLFSSIYICLMEEEDGREDELWNVIICFFFVGNYFDKNKLSSETRHHETKWRVRERQSKIWVWRRAPLICLDSFLIDVTPVIKWVVERSGDGIIIIIIIILIGGMGMWDVNRNNKEFWKKCNEIDTNLLLLLRRYSVEHETKLTVSSWRVECVNSSGGGVRVWVCIFNLIGICVQNRIRCNYIRRLSLVGYELKAREKAQNAIEFNGILESEIIFWNCKGIFGCWV